MLELFLSAFLAWGSVNIEESSSKTEHSQRTLGIVGDGQLGRMLTEAALKLGVDVKVLGKGGKQSSAGALAKCVDGDIKNPDDVVRFGKEVEVLIPEIEHIDVSGLIGRSDQTPMYPSCDIIQIIQNKFKQKEFFAHAGIPMGEYSDVPDQEMLETAVEQFGLPCMLKSKHGAYDGRGNYVLRSLNDPNLASAISKMGGYGNVYIEKWQPYIKELAIIVVRGKDGEIKTYPLTETIQQDSICFVTETRVNISESLQKTADELARNVVVALNGVGVFGIEMFLLNDGTILLNEVAPRVHNSGHYTLNGCVTSQFENHVRAALGLPLGDTSLNVSHIIMYNILGEEEGLKGEKIAYERIANALAIPGCYPYWYAKAGGVKKERKVGHINIVGDSQMEVRAKLQKIDPKAFELLEKTSPQ
jgi:phosphoribosylaminoimidazole carboxylase